MKTFRSMRYGFEIAIPDDWSMPLTGFLGRLLGLDKSLEFYGPSMFFNIRINPFLCQDPNLPEPTPHEIKASFITHSSRVGHTIRKTGSIQVGGKSHFWVRYMMGKPFVLQILAGRKELEPAGFDIIKNMKSYYRRVLGFQTNTNGCIVMDIEEGIGPMLKKYYLIFDKVEYNITCAIGYGTGSEVEEEFKERESEYDEIVSTFKKGHKMIQ